MMERNNSGVFIVDFKRSVHLTICCYSIYSFFKYEYITFENDNGSGHCFTLSVTIPI